MLKAIEILVVVCENCKLELHVDPKLSVHEAMGIKGWSHICAPDFEGDLCNVCYINPRQAIENYRKVVNPDG